MPSVSFAIDSRGAEQGAARFSAAISKVVADAQRAATVIGTLDRAIAHMGPTANSSATHLQKFVQQTNQIPRAVGPAVAQTGKFATTMRDLGSASVLAFGPLSGVGSRITAIGALATRSNLALGATIGVVTGVGVAVTASVKAAAEFEDRMLRVAKVTGVSSGELKKMSADVLRLSSTLGVPAVELAKIEQIAGQLNIRGSANLANFAEQIAILSRTADNLSVDEAANSIGRLLNLTGESSKNVAGMVAALTDLGNRSAATEKEILSMALELGRSTAAFDVSSQQLLALSGALADVGEKNERSGTAVQQVLTGIIDAAAGGEHLADFARLLNLTGDEFQRLAQANIGDVFLRVLRALAAEGPAATGVLRELELGSSRNFKVLLSLGQVIGTVGENLDRVSAQYANPTAAAAEFVRMNDGLVRSLEILGTQITNLGIGLGTPLLDPIESVVDALAVFLQQLQGIEPVATDASADIGILGESVIVAAESFRLAETLISGSLRAMYAISRLDFSGAFAGLESRTAELKSELASLGKAIKDVVFLPETPKEDLAAVGAAVGALVGHYDNASSATSKYIQTSSGLNESRESARSVAEAVSFLGQATEETEQRSKSAYNSSAKAVGELITATQERIEIQRIENELGKAYAQTYKDIQKIFDEGKGKGFTPAQADAIEAANIELVRLEEQQKNTTESQKDLSKSVKDTQKAYEDLTKAARDSLADRVEEQRQQGMTESEKAISDVIKKYDELVQTAVDGGAEEAKARADVNDEYEKELAIVRQINAEKQQKARDKVLTDLDREIELRRLANTEGESAAEAQRKINELTDNGVTVSDAYAQSVRQKTEALDELQEKSTVVADAFEDFISGIAAGTQELNLDGISDAFKAAFAASVKEKLKFDEIFEGNLFDLAGNVVETLGGAFKSVFSGAGNAFGSLFDGGGGGGGGFDAARLRDLGFSEDEIEKLQRQDGKSGGESGGGESLFGGILAGGLAGLLSSKLLGDLLLGPGSTGLPKSLATSEQAVLKNAAAFNQLTAVITGAIGGGVALALGAGALAGPIGLVLGGITSLLTLGLVSGVDREALRSREFSGIAAPAIARGIGVGTGAAAGASLGLLAGPAAPITVPLGAILGGLFGEDILFGLLGIPTLGTAFRRAGEGVIDASKIFGGDDGTGGLQGLLGDWTRTAHTTGIETARGRGFSDLQIEQVRGATETIFGKIFEDELPEDFGRLALEQGRTMAEFLSRGLAEGLTFDELFSSLRGFAEEAGITLVEAIGELPAVMAGVTAQAQEFGGLDPTTAAREGAAAYARELLGITALFQGDFPAGVNVAAIALSTLEKDGTKAFGAITQDTDTWLARLAEAPEEFQKQVSKLAGEGFQIDTAEFETRLRDISQSAEQIGSTIGAAFTAPDVESGIDAMVESLYGTISTRFSEGVLSQLFDKTGIAAAFEPVFLVLNNLQNFDLASAGGIRDAAAYIAAAVAQGRANLEEYIPILKVIIDEAEKADEIIKKALEPGPLEALSDAFEDLTKQIENDFKGAIAGAFQAGIAEVRETGDLEAGAKVFAATLEENVQNAVLNGIINAIVQSVVVEGILAPLLVDLQAKTTLALTDGVINATELAELTGLAKNIFEAGKDAVDQLKPIFNDLGRIVLDVDTSALDDSGRSDLGRGAERPRAGFGRAAMGGFFSDAAIVGEAGYPELVQATGGGFYVTPLDWEMANALMGAGATGYARGGLGGGGRNSFGGPNLGRNPGSGPISGRGTPSPWTGADPQPRGPGRAGGPSLHTIGGGGDGLTGPISLGEDFAVTINVRSVLEGFATGELEDFGQALQNMANESLLSGVTEALLTAGPLADIIADFEKTLTAATREAMSDGFISVADAESLKALADKAKQQIGAQITSLGPMFEALGVRVGAGVTAVSPLVGDVLGNAIEAALSETAGIAAFSLNARQAVFEHVRAGLIEAFINSAVIQGLLAGPLGVIESIFKQIGQKQLTIAEANLLLIEQGAALAGILDSDDFAASLQAMHDLIAGLGDSLGVVAYQIEQLPQQVQPILDTARDIIDAREDVCGAKCQLQKEIIDYGFAASDNYGRIGQTLVERYVPRIRIPEPLPQPVSPEDRFGLYYGGNNGNQASEARALREEVRGMREDLRSYSERPIENRVFMDGLETSARTRRLARKARQPMA